MRENEGDRVLETGNVRRQSRSRVVLVIVLGLDVERLEERGDQLQVEDRFGLCLLVALNYVQALQLGEIGRQDGFQPVESNFEFFQKKESETNQVKGQIFIGQCSKFLYNFKAT